MKRQADKAARPTLQLALPVHFGADFSGTRLDVVQTVALHGVTLKSQPVVLDQDVPLGRQELDLHPHLLCTRMADDVAEIEEYNPYTR